jgi:competence ComEA-like helix-hairpin-helix protein
VNINTADATTLAAELTGVGPALAQAIVKDRAEHGKFDTPDALTRVKGIGQRSSSRTARISWSRIPPEALSRKTVGEARRSTSPRLAEADSAGLPIECTCERECDRTKRLVSPVSCLESSSRGALDGQNSHGRVPGRWTRHALLAGNQSVAEGNAADRR